MPKDSGSAKLRPGMTETSERTLSRNATPSDSKYYDHFRNPRCPGNPRVQSGSSCTRASKTTRPNVSSGRPRDTDVKGPWMTQISKLTLAERLD